MLRYVLKELGVHCISETCVRRTSCLRVTSPAPKNKASYGDFSMKKDGWKCAMFWPDFAVINMTAEDSNVCPLCKLWITAADILSPKSKPEKRWLVRHVAGSDCNGVDDTYGPTAAAAMAKVYPALITGLFDNEPTVSGLFD